MQCVLLLCTVCFPRQDKKFHTPDFVCRSKGKSKWQTCCCCQTWASKLGLKSWTFRQVEAGCYWSLFLDSEAPNSTRTKRCIIVAVKIKSDDLLHDTKNPVRNWNSDCQWCLQFFLGEDQYCQCLAQLVSHCRNLSYVEYYMFFLPGSCATVQDLCWIKPAKEPTWVHKLLCTKSRSSVCICTDLSEARTWDWIWCSPSRDSTADTLHWSEIFVSDFRLYFKPAQESQLCCFGK